MHFIPRLRYPLLALMLSAATLAFSPLSNAHTIEISPLNPRDDTPVIARLEGLSPTSPPNITGYVERNGSTLNVYGTIGLGVLPAFSGYQLEVNLGRLPEGTYEAIYFGRFFGESEYEQWDSIQFGVSPAIPIPSLSHFSVVILFVLFLAVGCGAFFKRSVSGA